MCSKSLTALYITFNIAYLNYQQTTCTVLQKRTKENIEQIYEIKYNQENQRNQTTKHPLFQTLNRKRNTKMNHRDHQNSFSNTKEKSLTTINRVSKYHLNKCNRNNNNKPQ